MCIVSATSARKERALNSETVDLDHLMPSEKEAIQNVLLQYDDVFQDPRDNKLEYTSKVKHRNDTGNARPIKRSPYRLPHRYKGIVEEMISDKLDKKIIHTSSSPWSAPILLVPKKSPDGSEKMRFFTNFRGLNSVSHGDVYSTPNIVEMLESLANVKFFSKIDLFSGFRQVEIEEKDKEKTAFYTPFGTYEYNRLPFGIFGVPSTFQRLMDGVLAGLKGLFCFVYVDDIIIASTTIEEHAYHIKEVLERLRQANLKAHPLKCTFALKQNGISWTYS